MLDQRRLARAIGADESDKFTWPDTKAHPTHCGQPAVVNVPEIAGLEDVFVGQERVPEPDEARSRLSMARPSATVSGSGPSRDQPLASSRYRSSVATGATNPTACRRSG